MCAEMFDARVSLLASDASGALGVALLAAVGAGVHASVDAACSAAVRTQGALEPDPARVTAYTRVKARAAAAAKGALRVEH
jgi:L-ribulokinase